MEVGEGDSDSGKRPHVTTGDTPLKPEDKRHRSTGSFPSRSSKRLSFPRTPRNVLYLIYRFDICTETCWKSSLQVHNMLALHFHL